jgi:hypothetical protein
LAKLLLALFRQQAQNDSRWRCLLRLLSLLLALLVVVFIAVFPAQAQQGLTNTDVIKMQSAGLSESIILSSVNTQPAAYDTSTDGLLALKTSGVSDAVLGAMISRNAVMKTGVGNASGTNLPSAAAAGPPPGVDEVGAYYQDKNKPGTPYRPRSSTPNLEDSSKALQPMASSKGIRMATSKALRALPS